MTPTLYKIITIVAIAACVYLLYTNFTLSKSVKSLNQQLIQKEQDGIIERTKLIDSLQTNKILIAKELLSDESNIKKMKEALAKSKTQPLTIEETKKLLGL